MKRLLKIFLVVVGLSTVLYANGQNQGSMRINEYLVFNTDDYQDDFGQQSSWIELFNSSYGTVDIGGCYLTDDPDDLRKYPIPGGDILTAIKPRQHVIFWADNQPYRGTFHVSFDLENAKEILLVKSDGQTIIDRITVHKDLGENVSYGRLEDGVGSTSGDGEGWDIMTRTTPSTNNVTIDKTLKSRKLMEIDPHGAMMALMAMTIIFSALAVLYIIFKYIGKYNVRQGRKRAATKLSKDMSEVGYGTLPGEAYAAIAMALYLYRQESETHDEESYVMTMQHTDRSYSPWSSKIYSLRQTPQVRKK
ncbi:MAG: lamin tail domain-containing protein [Bacteroidales bacterium]|nr:lamin tail domain-containing protein [Bacteroidales bacterium]